MLGMSTCTRPAATGTSSGRLWAATSSRNKRASAMQQKFFLKFKQGCKEQAGWWSSPPPCKVFYFYFLDRHWTFILFNHPGIYNVLSLVIHFFLYLCWRGGSEHFLQEFQKRSKASNVLESSPVPSNQPKCYWCNCLDELNNSPFFLLWRKE